MRRGRNNIEGKTVPHVKIRDLQNQPIDLPYLGKAPLLLFLRRSRPCGPEQRFYRIPRGSTKSGGDKIQAYGIVNLKDAPLIA